MNPEISVAVLLVAYDLNKEIHRPNIFKKIKDNFAWDRLSESSYAIDTAMIPSDVLAFCVR